ncbi:MAG: dimethylamine corrinoid protein 3 [Proteobacteria bacterium]|nr:dimethylamine corrinoid protein 3 [Pseudomonadota bacterium]NIS70870.1 dimethylamine corrinoid protein 3 [Pseudomonadota bacterium]
MTKEEIFEGARKAIVERDVERAEELARRGLAEGVDPMELMNSGFIPGISEVGDLFGVGKLFLPELIQSAQAMQKVTEIINAALPNDVEKGKGTIIVGTVEGDIHDIGKTIVVSLFKANGFDVYDLGRDVPIDRFIEEAEKVKADIIGSSALLTTTMDVQRRLELKLKDLGLKGKYKTIVGGAPVTQRWANRIGADAFAIDAADGVKKAKELLGKD